MSSVLVAIALDLVALPSGPSLRCAIAGSFRGPSPLGAVHTLSPRFRSRAVIRPYGGFTSGSPRGPTTRVFCETRYRRFDDLGSPGIMFWAMGPVIEGTYNRLVSGSRAAPVQSAPPTVPGI